MQEVIRRKVRWIIEKYKNREDYRKGKPYEVKVIDGNILLNEGINEMWRLICGGTATAFDGTSQIGVGDGTTAEDATQTDLVGTNTAYVTVDSDYPTYGTNQKAVWKATFDENTGNFAWNEFTVKNSAGINLNRKVSSQGTKASGQVWTVTLEVTLS